jgi:hypothetical protein
MFVFQTGSRPRNPLLRLIGSILGLLVVLGVLALGFFAFLALLVGGALWMLVRSLRGTARPRPAKPAPSSETGIIDGEFTVVRDAPVRAALEHPAASIHGRNG